MEVPYFPRPVNYDLQDVIRSLHVSVDIAVVNDFVKTLLLFLSHIILLCAARRIVTTFAQRLLFCDRHLVTSDALLYVLGFIFRHLQVAIPSNPEIFHTFLQHLVSTID